MKVGGKNSIKEVEEGVRGRGREEGKEGKEQVFKAEKEAGGINKEEDEGLNWEVKIRFFEEKAEEILNYCREIKMKSRRPRNERKTKLQ